MENVWAEVKREVANKRPRTVNDITKCATNAWRRKTGDGGYVTALYDSMQDRLREVIAAKGGAISY